MVVTIDAHQIFHHENVSLWNRVQHRFRTHSCTCGNYIFYWECGHTIGSPLLRLCGGTLGPDTGRVVLCYHPARLVQVYNVNIRGRCRHCIYHGNRAGKYMYQPSLWDALPVSFG